MPVVAGEWVIVLDRQGDTLLNYMVPIGRYLIKCYAAILVMTFLGKHYCFNANDLACHK